jgi:hypothetical protein
MSMKLNMTALAICGLLVLPACRTDEGTRVPETRTPYMEEEQPLERDDDDFAPMQEDESQEMERRERESLEES